MAYTYCENCGEKIDDSGKFCPHCGCSKEGSGAGQQNSGNTGAYGAPGGGYGDNQGQYGAPGGGYSGGENPYGNYGGVGNGPLYRVPYSYQGRPRKLNTVVMVFSVIVAMFFNMICGFIAIGLALSAPNQPTKEMDDKKNQRAMIVNIIGIAIACLARVAVFLFWNNYNY